MDDLRFSQAIEGYLLEANSRKLSENTIRDYWNTFKKFDEFLESDPAISSISTNDQYLRHLWRRKQYVNRMNTAQRYSMVENLVQ